jgi:hypothetical protein
VHEDNRLALAFVDVSHLHAENICILHVSQVIRVGLDFRV